MINTKLLTVRNVLVIAVFALAWQLIFSRVHSFLHSKDQATQATS